MLTEAIGLATAFVVIVALVTAIVWKVFYWLDQRDIDRLYLKLGQMYGYDPPDDLVGREYGEEDMVPLSMNGDDQ